MPSLKPLGSLFAALLLVVSLALPDVAYGKRKAKRRPARKAKAVVTQPTEPPAAEAQPTEPPAAEAQPAGPVKVAVLELGMLGLSSAMRKNLEMLMRNSIATIEGFKLITPVDVQMALQNPKNAAVAQCGGGPECAVQVGRLVGADRVVFGTVGAMGESFSLDLRVMDVGSGKQLAREHSRIAGSRDLLIPELRLAAYRMVAPDKIRGSLLVDIDVAGVEVEIDGERVGVTPLIAPIDALTPGSHVVGLKRPGVSAFQQEFVIKPFETARLKLELGKASPAAAPAPVPASGGSAKN